MSTPSGTTQRGRQLDLMQLHDGELTADQNAELDELSAEEERMLDGLEQLGEVLRAHTENRSAGGDGVADLVMARLDEPAPKSKTEKPRVESIERARKAPPQKAKVAPVVAIGLALAAAAAYALWPKPATDTAQRPAPMAQTADPRPVEGPIAQVTPQVMPDPDLADEDGKPAASIEAVDFGNGAGTIFMVPAGDESTPVVWLDDEPTGGRMERL